MKSYVFSVQIHSLSQMEIWTEQGLAVVSTEILKRA